jgi:hypothetical protein
MNAQLKNFMSKHWADMLAGEQCMAWKDPDIWGDNYQMDADHAEDSVMSYLSCIEQNEELKDMYCLVIDDVDWEALKEEAVKQATVEWNTAKETAQ